MRFARLGLASFAAAASMVGSLGCSDPVPPTPRGAFYVGFVDSGVDCAIAGHNTQVGVVNDHERTEVLTDGVDGAAIECKVTGSGAFAASGSISHGGDYLAIDIPSIKFPDATKDAPVTGSASFASFKTIDTYSSTASGCNFYFVNNGANGQGVGAGKIWASFECPAVQADMSVCKIQQGYVIFENCVTGNEEE